MGTQPQGAAGLKLLLDEMLNGEIAVQMRQRGWDVEAIQTDHREMIGLDDAEVLEQAAGLGRTLVTDNARDFVPLHRRWLNDHRAHHGILLASSRSYPRGKQTIGLWVDGLEQALIELGDMPNESFCDWLR